MQSYFETLSVDLGSYGSLAFLESSPRLQNIGETNLNNNLTQIEVSNDPCGLSVGQQSVPNQPANIINNIFEENDVFQCGKCKQQFNSLQLFLQHKTAQCGTTRQAFEQGQVILQDPVLQRPSEMVASLNNNQVLFDQTTGIIATNDGRCHDMATNVVNDQNMTAVQGNEMPPAPNNVSCITSVPMQNLHELQTRNVAPTQPYTSSQSHPHAMSNITVSDATFGQPQQVFSSPPCPVNVQPQRILLTEEMLLQPTNEMLNNNPNQSTSLGDDGSLNTDVMNNGNGLISSLLQQIPPFDPMEQPTNIHGQKMALQTAPTILQDSQQICNSNVQMNSELITITTIPANAQSQKPREKTLKKIIPRLYRRTVLPNSSETPPPVVSICPINHTPVEDEATNVADDIDNAGEDSATYDSKKKFLCPYCKKQFNKNFDMEQHKRSHTGEKPFQCIVCGRAFAQKSNVKKHMVSHKVWLKGNGAYLQPFAKDGGGKQPGENGEGIDSNELFVCEYCGKGFPTYNKRKSHMNEHKDQQVYKCLKESCSSTFRDLDEFVAHVKSHENDMTYRCHQCHKVFKSLRDMGVHQYQVHLRSKKKSAQSKLYACTECPSKFTHPTALQEHIISDPHMYVCRICDSKFSCERYLRKHYILQHKDQQNTTKNICTVCGKALRSMYYLRLHMLIHTKELPYRCSKCGAAFNRKDKVKRHMLTHDPVKRFKCPLKSFLGCTKEFSRADKLKEHIISHSGVKKTYSCSFCSKKYRRHLCKVKHEKSHTSGLVCSVCNRGFENEENMKSHRCRKTNLTPSKKIPTRSSSRIAKSSSASDTTVEEGVADKTGENIVPQQSNTTASNAQLEEPFDDDSNQSEPVYTTLLSEKESSVLASAETLDSTIEVEVTVGDLTNNQVI